ncbi:MULTISPECIES: glycosyltransferase family 2 protein [unclassified Blastococcus]
MAGRVRRLGTMTTGPAVTVVIPTRNRLDLVRRSVSSALAQDGVPVDVVVVDDGSDAATAGALDALASCRVRIIHHPASLGVSRARNAGIAVARTAWVALCDDDDYWAPDKLRSQLEALAAAPGAGWSSVGAVHVDDAFRPLHWHEPPTPETTPSVLARTGGIPGGGSGVLAATALARQVGGFDPALSILADWDFYYRLALAAPVAPVNRPLVGYYRHSDSMFHDPVGLDRELVAIERKYRTGAAPMDLDHTSWAVQLLLMAVRSRDPRVVAKILRSRVLRQARKPALARAAIARVRAGADKDRRHCPSAWSGESLEWVTWTV